MTISLWTGVTYIAKPAVRIRTKGAMSVQQDIINPPINLTHVNGQWKLHLPDCRQNKSIDIQTYAIQCDGKVVGRFVYQQGQAHIELNRLDTPVLIESGHSFTNCDIKSETDIILGKCRTPNVLYIQAPNITIADTTCANDIRLNAIHQIQINNTLTANELLQCYADNIKLNHTITSPVVKMAAFKELSQTGALLAEKKCSLRTKKFTQHGSIKSNGVLKISSDDHMLSEQAKCKSMQCLKINSGQVTNYGSLTSKQNNLMTIDSFNNYGKIKLNNSSIVATRHFRGHSSSQLISRVTADAIEGSDNPFRQLFKSQQGFYLDKGANVELNQTMFMGGQLDIHGICQLRGTKIQVSDLKIAGDLHTSQSVVTVQGNVCVATGGNLHAETTSLCADLLTLESTSQLNASRVEFHLQKMADIQGHGKLNGSILTTKDLKIKSRLEASTKSSIQAKGTVSTSLSGSLVLNESQLKSIITDVEGTLNATKSWLESMSIKLKHVAVLNGSVVQVDYLEMPGAITVRNSQLLARKALRQTTATAKCELSQSELESAESYIKGTMTLRKTNLHGKQLNLWGTLRLADGASFRVDELISDPSSQLHVFDKSTGWAKDKTQLGGKSVFRESMLITNELSLPERSKTKFVVSDIFSLQETGPGVASTPVSLTTLSSEGMFQFSRGNLLANYMHFSNSSSMHKAKLSATLLAQQDKVSIRDSSIQATFHDILPTADLTSRKSTFTSTYSQWSGQANLRGVTLVADVMAQPEGKIVASSTKAYIKQAIHTYEASRLELSEDSTIVGIGEADAPIVTGLLDGATTANKTMFHMPALTLRRADLTDSRIDSEHLHISDEVNAAHSMLRARKGTLNSGALQLTAGSHLESDQLTTLANSRFAVNKSTANIAGDVIGYGSIDIDAQSVMSANRMTAYQKLKLSESSRLNILEDLVFSVRSEVEVDASDIAANQVFIENILKVNSSYQKNKKGGYDKKASSIVAKKDLSFCYGSHTHAKHAQFIAKNAIIFASDVKASGDSLLFKARLFDNQGHVDVNKLTIDADYLMNLFGSIRGGEQLNITADKFLFNLGGNIRADKLNVKAGMSFDFIGDMVGYDSFDLSALVNVNLLGAHRSYNYRSNALINLDFGLTMPSLPNSPDAVFSWSHLSNVFKTGLNLIAPGMSPAINLAFQMEPWVRDVSKITYNKLHGDDTASYMSLLPGAQLRELYRKVFVNPPGKQLSWRERLGQLRVTDVLPSLLAVKSVGDSASGLYHSGSSFVDGFQTDDATGSSTWSRTFSSNPFTKTMPNGQAIFDGIATTLGPSISQNSLASTGIGVAASANVTRSDYWACNGGIAVANTLIHNGGTIINKRAVLGSRVIMSGNKLESGIIKNWNSMNLRFKTIDIKRQDHIDGYGAQIYADNLNDDGRVTLQRSRLEVKKLVVGSTTNHDAELAAYETHSKLGTADNYGKTQITGLTKEQANAEETAKVTNANEQSSESHDVIESQQDASAQMQNTSEMHQDQVDHVCEQSADTTQLPMECPDSQDVSLSSEADINKMQAEPAVAIDRTKAESYSSKLEADRLTNHEGGYLNISHTWSDVGELKTNAQASISDGYQAGKLLDIQGGALQLANLTTNHESIHVAKDSKLLGHLITGEAGELNNQGEVSITESQLSIKTVTTGGVDNHAARTEVYQSHSSWGTIDNYGFTRVTGLTQTQAGAESAARAAGISESTPEELNSVDAKQQPDVASEQPTQDTPPEQASAGASDEQKPEEPEAGEPPPEIDIESTKRENYSSSLETDRLTNHEQGVSEISHTWVDAKETLENQGNMLVSHSYTQGKELVSGGNNARFEAIESTLANQTVHMTDTIVLKVVGITTDNIILDQGLADLKQVQIHAGQAKLGNVLEVDAKDVWIGASNIEQSSKIAFEGGIAFNASEHLNITDDSAIHAKHKTKKDILALTGSHGSLNGDVSTGVFSCDIADLTNPEQLIQGVGKYQSWEVGYDLALVTPFAVDLSAPINRQCGLSITGQSIDFRTDYQLETGRIHLKSTEGAIRVWSHVTSEYVYLDSATNIEDHGGWIQGTRYLQGVAVGDIIVLANEHSFQGKHDTEKTFTPAFMLGGTGLGDGKLGLLLKAGGKLVNVGSTIGGSADGYIEAKKGVESQALSHTRVTEKKTKRKWYGSKKTKEKTATATQDAVFTHTTGGLDFYVPEGGIDAVGTHFLTRDGTRADARDNIKLYSLITTDKVTTKTQSLWGLNRSSSKSSSQRAAPTIIADNGTTILKSSEGSILGQGAVVLGDGDFYTSAENGKVRFSQDILKHSIKTKTSGFSVSAPVVDTARQAISDPKQFLKNLDSSIAKLDALLHSHGSSEWLANGANAATALYNSTQQWTDDISQRSIGDICMDRTGLSALANPLINITYAESKSNTQFQTLGQGIVKRRSWKIDAETAIIDGICFDISKDMTVNADTVLFRSAQLESSTKQERKSASIGITPTGEVVSASMSHDKSTQKNKTIQQQDAHVSGNLHINSHDTTLDGIKITANTSSGHSDNVTIITRQDETQTKTTNFSGDTHGQVGFHHAKAESATTSNVAGFHIQQGINHDETHPFTVNTLINQGGAITTDGINQFAAGTVINKEVHDYERGRSLGFSGNMNTVVNALTVTDKEAADVESESRLIPHHIDTVTVSIGKRDYEAVHQATYHGQQGISLQFGHTEGSMHTASADGFRVIRDKQQSISLDVPIINPYSLFKSPALPAISQVPIEPIKTDELDLSQPDESTLLSPHAEVESTIVNEMEDVLPEQVSSNQAETLATPDMAMPFVIAEENEVFSALYHQATTELDSQGQLSEATEYALKERVTDAVLLALKKVSKEVWEAIVKNMGPEYQATLIQMLKDPSQRGNIGVKVWGGYVKLLIIFGFNMGLTDGSTAAEHTSNAAKATMGNLTFSIVLRRTVGPAAGAIGWTWMGLDVIDTLCHDQTYVDQLFQSSLDDILEAQKQTSWLDGWRQHGLAADQMEIAREMRSNHQLLELPGRICNAISDYFTSEPTASTEEPTTEFKHFQMPQNFFQPAQTQDVESPSVALPHLRLSPEF